jgi:hypothetical protein
MPSRRRRASFSPSTASPRRLRFSRAPDSRIVASGAELVGSGVDDEVPDHLAEHAAGDRHDGSRQHRRDGTARADGGAKIPRQEVGDERSDALQVGCRGGERLGAHDAVDEADREGQTVRSLSTPASRSAAGSPARPPTRRPSAARARRPDRRGRGRRRVGSRSQTALSSCVQDAARVQFDKSDLYNQYCSFSPTFRRVRVRTAPPPPAPRVGTPARSPPSPTRCPTAPRRSRSSSRCSSARPASRSSRPTDVACG